VTATEFPHEPAGLVVVDTIDGVPYLVDIGDEHKFRVLGWYYGYPVCCVEAFIASCVEAFIARDALSHHPVSGHLLCRACQAAPMAPLPPRPAERYGRAEWDEDENRPLLYPPKPYDPPTREKPERPGSDLEEYRRCVVGQLELDLSGAA
jgi:hypothetical protein